MNYPGHFLLGFFVGVVVGANVQYLGVDTLLQMPDQRLEVPQLVGRIVQRPSPISTARVQSAASRPVRPITIQQGANEKRDRLERVILQFANHEPLDRMTNDLSALYPGLFRWDHLEGENPSFRKYQIAYSFRKEIVSFVLDDYETLTDPQPDQ